MHALELADGTPEAGEILLARASEHAAAAGLSVRTECVSGRAIDQIPRTADRLGCDLIVIGGNGRPGYARTLLGSVARGVMRTARAATLVVHEQAVVPQDASLMKA